MNTVFVIAGLAVLTLTGCAGHTHALAPASRDPSVTVGTFSHDGRAAPEMVLEVGGRRFFAQGFAIRRDVNLSASQQHNSRGWRPSWISPGSDTEHYDYSANPELHAADGAVLRCTLTWSTRQAPAGNCEMDEGARIAVRFE